AMGVLERRGRGGNRGEGVMGIPIPGAKGNLPSGLSAAEVALGEISKSSPPPSRGGGHIQDRGRRTSSQRRPSEMLGGKSAGWQGEAVAGDTIFEAVGSPLSTSTSGSGTGSGQKRSRSKPSPRPRPATPAVTALRGIPYEPRRPTSSSSSSSATTAAPPRREENNLSPRPPARMYTQPYPISTPDFSAPLPPAKYPRQTGPLPIEYAPALSTAPVLKTPDPLRWADLNKAARDRAQDKDRDERISPSSPRLRNNPAAWGGTALNLCLATSQATVPRL
ncbi:hypothetical protein V501_09199, partial [Pseudogymnoascus sp. VKM F-4519 (FW-2642)]